MTDDEDDVDDHLEERVEDPPDVAQEGVGALLLEVGLDEVADQPAPRPDLAQASPTSPTGPGLAALLLNVGTTPRVVSMADVR